jgi:CubicO group peptidase (beta-lactamase class C family)
MKATLVSLVAFACAAPALADGYPIGTPETMLDGGHRIGALRNWDALFPTRAVARGAIVSALEDGPALELSPLQLAVLARADATGLIVVKDGAVRAERYWLGADAASRFTSMSVAKSITSVLAGETLADGLIKGVDVPVTDYLPELKGGGYDGVPVSAILQMSSGIAFDEAPGSWADAARFWTETAVRHDTGVLAWAKAARRAHAPSTVFKYSGLDTAVLGLLVERISGKPMADYLSGKIWSPMGAQADASWGLDGDGRELAYCCLNATLRDYARLGRFLMTDVRIAPWMAQSSRAHRKALAPGALSPGYPLGYGYQWWLAADAFMAHGSNGQFLYLDPDERLVIVLVSAWPDYWDYVREAEVYRLFAEIAAALR